MASEIHFFSEEISFSLEKENQTQNWIEQTIIAEDKRPGHISFIFCSDEHLLSINIQYLQHDYLTDVITFDYSENQLISGDVFISIERVTENARSSQSTFVDELHRVMIHGVLHLLGYKDKAAKDKSAMTSKEDYYLSLRSFS